MVQPTLDCTSVETASISLAALLRRPVEELLDAIRTCIIDWESLESPEICAFVSEALSKPNAISEIETAVAISFVEAHELRSTATGRAILKLMPDNVRTVLLEQEKRGGVQ